MVGGEERSVVLCEQGVELLPMSEEVASVSVGGLLSVEVEEFLIVVGGEEGLQL